MSLSREEFGNFFTVIFPRPALTTRKTTQKSSEKIISLIRKNPQISAESIASAIGISSRGVEKQISRLKEEGLLKRIGPAKGGRWEVPDDD